MRLSSKFFSLWRESRADPMDRDATCLLTLGSFMLATEPLCLQLLWGACCSQWVLFSLQSFLLGHLLLAMGKVFWASKRTVSKATSLYAKKFPLEANKHPPMECQSVPGARLINLNRWRERINNPQNIFSTKRPWSKLQPPNRARDLQLAM